MHNLSKTQAIVSWALQLAAAGILLQTLFFKFTASEESVYIFTTLGVEPWGRIATGILELIASVLLLPTFIVGLYGQNFEPVKAANRYGLSDFYELHAWVRVSNSAARPIPVGVPPA